MNFQEDYLGPAGDSVEGFALNVPVFFRLSDYVTTESICLDPENDSYPTYVEPIGGAVFEREGDEAPDAAVEEAQFCTESGSPNIFVVNLSTVSGCQSSYRSPAVKVSISVGTGLVSVRRMA